MLASEKEKQEWAERHARRIKQRFEEWQKPLGIDSEEYYKYLKEDLFQCIDEPDWRKLIESIS